MAAYGAIGVESNLSSNLGAGAQAAKGRASWLAFAAADAAVAVAIEECAQGGHCGRISAVAKIY